MLLMETIATIDDFNQIKILTDVRRLAILRLLMAGPFTLSQLGQALGEHPAWVRHHLKKLEQAGLVELMDFQDSGGVLEKYYQANARALILNKVILPASYKPGTLVFFGSHDLGLTLIVEKLSENQNFKLLMLPVGSLDGLIALRQGYAQLSGCHIYDPSSGEYNRPIVQHMFPEVETTLVTLAQRTQGLMVAPGNPLHILGFRDLTQDHVVLVNRNRGSGTRLWIDREITRLGLTSSDVRGYDCQVRTHTETAQTIQQGKATVGIGLEAAAWQAGLGFIPLFKERYDLVLMSDHLENSKFQILLEFLQTQTARTLLQQLRGYDTEHTGHIQKV